MNQDILNVLQSTSRTFYIPIARLPDRLQDAVVAAYLCMRAIDEIEDHPTLDRSSKAAILRDISRLFRAQTTVVNFAPDDLAPAFRTHADVLPNVSTRIGEWARQAPESIAPRIWSATATMADAMAQWVDNGWAIRTPDDLDRYTFDVAGSVGVLLCDVWAWFDGAQMDRAHAIQFGRGLQAVNIARNRLDDQARGVDLFPVGWTASDVRAYARCNLGLAEAYARTLARDAFTYLIRIPLALAYATLDALDCGQPKLDRLSVDQLIGQLDREHS